MFVREQPGDREGRLFIGPAGLLLDKALVEAGVDRKRIYVTNAVKHFKFEARGKRRLHKRPNASEIKICRHWLSPRLPLAGRGRKPLRLRKFRERFAINRTIARLFPR
jgi:DNA polymerase